MSLTIFKICLSYIHTYVHIVNYQSLEGCLSPTEYQQPMCFVSCPQMLQSSNLANGLVTKVTQNNTDMCTKEIYNKTTNDN